MMRYLICVLAVLFSSLCMAQQARVNHLSDNPNLKPFLKQLLNDPRFGEDRTTRISLGSAHLHEGTAEEVFAYVSGQSWCGSSGCTAFLLEPTGSTYRVISKFTLVQLPVRVLASTTNGWHDLSVPVRGGGVVPGYEALLGYNGKKYPSNPSMPPAKKLITSPPGELLVPADADGESLF